MVSGFMVATMYAGFSSACADIRAKELQLKDLSPKQGSAAGSVTDSTSLASRQITPLDKDADDAKDGFEISDDLPTILTSPDRFNQWDEKPFP